MKEGYGDNVLYASTNRFSGPCCIPKITNLNFLLFFPVLEVHLWGTDNSRSLMTKINCLLYEFVLNHVFTITKYFKERSSYIPPPFPSICGETIYGRSLKIR